MTYTATYSPDDNKLRLYASARLDAELYARVRKAGFSWAAKQGLFVAPAWTPDREDLLLELAGQIDDEDKTLVERAEERAERFDGYRENRTADAERARVAVSQIADNIPFGQPILVGHHSEKHARKDAERIQNGMRRAVQMWKTAEYWEHRAAGALAHAAHKERPDVRARRIKTIEAAARKIRKSLAEVEQLLEYWRNPLVLLKAEFRDTPGALVKAIRHLASRDCWAVYERNETPNASDSFVRCSEALDKGVPALDVQARAIANKEIALRPDCSARRWLEHYDNRLTYERAMLAESGGTVADRIGPEKGGACKCWASPRGGWSYIVKVNRISVTVWDNWGNGGANFTRTIPFDKLAGVMKAADVQAARDAGRLVEVDDKTGFVLLDEPTQPRRATHTENSTAAPFEALEDSLRAGVQVVSVPDLFPTPRDLAQRMVQLADIQPGHRVLEPSAGTGMILGAMGGRMFGHNPERGAVVAVEVNAALAERLRREFPLTTVFTADFLIINGELGAEAFDRVVMNPPFTRGADIQHITHALKLVRPGGRLVALCASGPRQERAFAPLVSHWELLEAGTFEGTNVHAALLVVDV